MHGKNTDAYPWATHLLLLALSGSVPGCDQGRHVGPNGKEDGTSRAASESNGAESDDLEGEGAVDREDAASINADDLVDKGASLITASYSIKGQSLGLPICDGRAQLKVNAAIGRNADATLFELPKHSVDCKALGKMDLSAILGIFSTSMVNPKLSIKDDIIHIETLGHARYSPPRPLLPSFVAASRPALKELDYARTVTLVDQKSGKSTSGQIAIRMLRFGQTVKSVELQRTFDDVMTFEIVNTGFEGIDRPANFLFDRIEMSLSLNPLAILSLTFQGDAKSLKDTAVNNPGMIQGLPGELITALPSADKANPGLFDKLFGGITDSVTKSIKVDIQMALLAQDQLDQASGRADDGVTIGR